MHKLTNNGAFPTLSLVQSNISSDNFKSTVPASITAPWTRGILVLNNAALTARDTASNKLPPHSKI